MQLIICTTGLTGDWDLISGFDKLVYSLYKLLL